MITSRILQLTLVVAFGLLGCTRSATSPAGFRLPDGSEEQGRATFVNLQCHECHAVKGEQFPETTGANPPYVQLGGPVTRVKTYGELVTAIINPSHKLSNAYAAKIVSKDGVSNMPVYNDHMTVRELTDLVTFLQARYDVVVPQRDYRVYPY